MGTSGRKGKGTLLLAMLLLAAGLVLVVAPARTTALIWLARLWPVFLICIGVVRVMGFAVERKPPSPTGGMLLIIAGVLFLLNRLHSNLNGLQIYGRYWLLLLGVFAAVELVRFYTHPHKDGAPPRLFTPWRVLIILVIVTTGALANRVAGNNPSLLSALKLPRLLSGIRDSVIGVNYRFADPPVAAGSLRPGARITVENSYGNVRITGGGAELKAALTKDVRAWDEEEARKIANQIHLVITQTPEGLKITTNRDQVGQQFTTTLQIEAPSDVLLLIANSYGAVTVSGIEEDVSVKNSHGPVEISNLGGDVTGSLTHSDFEATKVLGDIRIKGAKLVKLSGIQGGADVDAAHGAVELRDIIGPVRVNAPFCKITAQGLGSEAELKTQHAAVQVARAADLTIQAPNSDVRAENVDGSLQISCSHGEVRLRSISGQVKVDADQSSVTAEEIHGTVEIETSHGDVAVSNFYEGLRVKTSFRDVTLVAAGPPLDNIEVETSHGRIRLVLPESSEFQLEATSQGGEVRPIGFPSLARTPGNTYRVSVGGVDGPQIKLRTSYKTITIQASSPRQVRAGRLVNETAVTSRPQARTAPAPLAPQTWQDCA